MFAVLGLIGKNLLLRLVVDADRLAEVSGMPVWWSGLNAFGVG